QMYLEQNRDRNHARREELGTGKTTDIFGTTSGIGQKTTPGIGTTPGTGKRLIFGTTSGIMTENHARDSREHGYRRENDARIWN
ncbi:hypothetical protein AVEN_40596-1, partial [Araneus ventricosus]